MPLVSVIVPVYKTEKQLEKCVNSLLNQTLKDIEIILVDDGSPDNCPKMCDDFKEKDCRIKVIHKENGGLSSARNAALEIAKGDYIGFVDSDDFVDEKMFEKMHSKISEDNSDICICSHYNFFGDTLVSNGLPFDCSVLYKEEILQKLICPLIGYSNTYLPKIFEGFVCRQLFRKASIKDIKFKSEKTYFAEDVVFDFEVYQKADKVSILNECLYYYYNNPISLSNKYRENLWDTLCNLLDYKKSVINDLNIANQTNERFNNEALKFVKFTVLNFKKSNCPLTNEEKINQLKKMFNNHYTKPIKKLSFIFSQDFKTTIFLLLFKFKQFSLIIRFAWFIAI